MTTSRVTQTAFRCIIPLATCNRPCGQISVHKPTKRRCYHEVSYAKHGEPADVLEYLSTDKLKEFPQDPKMVQVEMIHVPWNPADVNTVQGKYASPYNGTNISPPNNASQYFPKRSVSGSEGWGRIVTSKSSSLPAGSFVTVGTPGLGTLRTSFWASESDVLHVPSELLDQVGPAGSTLFQLGGTALRMLTDFVSVQPGDLVIQNAGNSGVGLMVSQLAPAFFAAPVVSLVRRGSKSNQDMDELIDYLTTVGKNAMVLMEEDMEDPQYLKEVQAKLKELSASGRLPKLALNSVGGESAKCLLRLLDTGGSLVTYGGMSGKPVIVGTPQLIFKDLRAIGYWHSRWMVRNSLPAKQQLIDDLARAVKSKGVVCPPCQVFPLNDVSEALNWQSNQIGGIRSKLVFDCRE